MRSPATLYRIFRSEDGGCSIHREPVPARMMFPVDLRLDLRSHSPTGAEVGYCGSGPAQAALAILADFTEDDRLACALYQRFKEEMISRLSREAPMVTLSGSDIAAWIETRATVEEILDWDMSPGAEG